MEFMGFIVTFLALICVFFVGYIVGFCNGKEQRAEEDEQAKTQAPSGPFPVAGVPIPPLPDMYLDWPGKSEGKPKPPIIFYGPDSDAAKYDNESRN